MKVSEAYATLGSPEKRKRYDIDILPQPSSSSSAPYPSAPHARSGSYSSASSPVGARPASGLSRRRTQFRGPPPSFYRNGGWGAYGQKRQAQADETAQAHSRATAAAEAAAAAAAAAAGAGAGGMGPGQGQAGFSNDVPHFDQEGHLRTHEQQELRWRRRRRRRQEDSGGYEDGTSMLIRFLLIGGIVSLAYAPFAVFTGSSQATTIHNSRKEQD